MPNEINAETDIAIQQLITRQLLPPSYRAQVDEYLVKLSGSIAMRQQYNNTTMVIGINGGQGSGKSTLCLFLQLLLEKQFKKHCVVLSIDDFYLSRSDRKNLAENQHPLLITRGVPGTHDTRLAVDTIEGLQKGHVVALPRFDKSSDDIVDKKHWPIVDSKVDVILFEGWCVGAKPQSVVDLEVPINELEKNEDVDGSWRKLVNKKLIHEYRCLFEKIDYLVMLKVPSMASVYEWRNLQESKLAESAQAKGEFIMSKAQIKRFVDHYERLTCYLLEEMPSRADVVLTLSGAHEIVSAIGLDDGDNND